MGLERELGVRVNLNLHACTQLEKGDDAMATKGNVPFLASRGRRYDDDDDFAVPSARFEF